MIYSIIGNIQDKLKQREASASLFLLQTELGALILQRASKPPIYKGTALNQLKKHSTGLSKGP